MKRFIRYFALAAVMSFAINSFAETPTLRSLGSKHNMKIGTLVEYLPLANNEEYKKIVKQEYSLIVPWHAMKMRTIQANEGEYSFIQAEQIANFARKNKQEVHGYLLMWHRQNPSWLTEKKRTPEQKKNILKDHILKTVGHFTRNYPNTVTSWEVANDVFEKKLFSMDEKKNSGFLDTYWSDIGEKPDDYIKMAFRWARQAAPNALLYYNDFGNEVINKKSDAIYKMVKNFKEEGVPIDVVGFKCHMNPKFGVPSVEDMRKNIQRFYKIGVKSHFTELDGRIYSGDGISKQEKKDMSQIYTNIYKACKLEKEACVGVTSWGFSTAYSWLRDMFKDHEPYLPYDENLKPTTLYRQITETLK